MKNDYYMNILTFGLKEFQLILNIKIIDHIRGKKLDVMTFLNLYKMGLRMLIY